MKDVPFTFAAVAQPVAARGWRPFPGLQTSKVPAMKGWSGLNLYEWDDRRSRRDHHRISASR